MLFRGVKKLILIRLFAASLLLYAPQAFEDVPAFIFYGVSSLICLLSVFYILWFTLRRGLRALAITQISIDILLEAYLVYFTGGAESLFTILFILSGISTAFTLGGRRSIFLTTFLSSLAYLFSALLARHSSVYSALHNDNVYLFYGTTIRIVIFFVVAYLSRQLSTKLFELEDQLKLANRLSLLGEAAAKIAHEVRSPLSSIRTAAEVLKDTLAGKMDAQTEKMVTIVESESSRLAKTLQRILDYAKPANLNQKMLQLDPLIERTLSLISLQSQEKTNDVHIEKKYDILRTRVYADEEQILSAFLNLILNAYQAMADGDILKISAVEDLNATTITFQDKGGGIPQEKLKDLFLPFKSSKKGGTGLGLAEVHKIVTLHEGKIEVESMAGEGTTFRLAFPKP